MEPEAEILEEKEDQLPVTEQEDQIEDDKEPSGTDGQAVRARKEYLLRKKTETALQVERERGIALEARVQTLQEVATRKVDQPPVVEKRLTGAEAWAKFDTQEWTRDQVTDYIFDTRYQERRVNERAEEKAAKEILEPLAKAKKEALEYVALDPRLANATHPKWGAIRTEVSRLLTEGGIRTQIQAEREALRTILGPIDQLKEKQKMSDARPSGDAHTETRGAIGPGRLPPNKKDAFPDIPAHVKELWDKFGTTEEQRKTEAKFYRESKASRGK